MAELRDDFSAMKIKFFTCLTLSAALALTACPTTHPKEKEKKAAATAPTNDESGAVDFQAFIGRLRMAVAAHDVNAVASMMTVDFGYRLNPEAAGPGVFQYWDENNLWGELNGVLAERFVPKDNYMVAPPQFADPATTYDGYRAGIRRVNGSWKFAYFVNG
jgi:hypothetical protein